MNKNILSITLAGIVTFLLIFGAATAFGALLEVLL